MGPMRKPELRRSSLGGAFVDIGSQVQAKSGEPSRTKVEVFVGQEVREGAPLSLKSDKPSWLRPE